MKDETQSLSTDDVEHLPHLVIIRRTRTPYIDVLEFPAGTPAHLYAGKMMLGDDSEDILDVVVAARVRKLSKA